MQALAATKIARIDTARRAGAAALATSTIKPGGMVENPHRSSGHALGVEPKNTVQLDDVSSGQNG
jgi:hypothetical protein